jgi:hypothetical protein
MEEHQGARVAGAEGGGRQGGDRQVVQGPVGCREDLGFEPEGGGSHGGLWAGEGGPGSWAPPGGCGRRWGVVRIGVGDHGGGNCRVLLRDDWDQTPRGQTGQKRDSDVVPAHTVAVPSTNQSTNMLGPQPGAR